MNLGNQYGDQISGLQGSANNLQELYSSLTLYDQSSSVEQDIVYGNMESEQQNLGGPNNNSLQQQLGPYLNFDGFQGLLF